MEHGQLVAVLPILFFTALPSGEAHSLWAVLMTRTICCLAPLCANWARRARSSRMELADSRAARLVVIGFDGPTPTPEVAQLIARGVRSIILFARNAGPRAAVSATATACKALTSEPLLVCVDQEGGNTVRLTDGFDPPPPMREVGEGGPVAAGLVGARLAADLRPVGIDLNLAPVVDVDSNPNNPIIGPRSFSREPATVGACGAALITAMQAGGVAACAKHFPGHGDTETDSHHDLPVLKHDIERLRSVELPPFRDAVAAGVAAVMTTHGVTVSSNACANCAKA